MYVTDVIYEDENVKFSAEAVEDMFFCHCDINHYNKSIIKDLKEICIDIFYTAMENGFSGVYTYSMNERFIKVLGFKYEILDSIEYNNKTVKVIKFIKPKE